MNGFEVREVRKFVLINEGNGKPVIDEHGRIYTYDTAEQAEFVAASWDLHRMPTYDELQAMTDDDLHRRAGLLGRFRR